MTSRNDQSPQVLDGSPELDELRDRLRSLIDQPNAFTVNPLLTSQQFERKARDRGLDVSLGALEALHRADMVRPLFGVDFGFPNTKDERHAWRDGFNPNLTSVGGMALDLRAYAAAGRLVYAPDYRPWSWTTTQRGHRYARRRYLFSSFQLLDVRAAKEVRFTHRVRDDRRVRTFIRRREMERWRRARETTSPEIILALESIAGIYLPLVSTEYGIPIGVLDDWPDIWNTRDAAGLLQWTRMTPADLLAAVGVLFAAASSVDPLAEWHPLTRLVAPQWWPKLRGDARCAMDYRQAAELLLLLYEDISASSGAPALGQTALGPRIARERLHGETGSLDRVLTAFGLSPHPSVVVVVEGETELHLLPRVLDALHGTWWRRYAVIVHKGGVDKNIETLVGYAITPRLGREFKDLVELDRPPAGLIVVTDPEGSQSTVSKREKQLTLWLKRLASTIDAKFHGPKLSQALLGLIEIQTWDEAGQNFEFANFSDRELASALAVVHGRPEDAASYVSDVADLRRRTPKIERAWARWTGRRPTKLEFADALWAAVNDAGTLAGRPVARIADRVIERIQTLPRSDVVIRTESTDPATAT